MSVDAPAICQCRCASSGRPGAGTLVSRSFPSGRRRARWRYTSLAASWSASTTVPGAGLVRPSSLPASRRDVSSLSRAEAEELGVDVDVGVAGLSALGHELVDAGQEGGDACGRGLEEGLPEGRGQLDVQDPVGVSAVTEPDPDVADALAALDAAREEVAGEDPLDRLV